jgi:multicomponent Na+:H+ antiporter subunit G
MTALSIILMVGGAFFLTVSCIGLLRLPDFYTRTHAVGKSETLGTILMLLGLIIYNGWAIISLKILLILLFVGIANPTATHAVLRAAIYTCLEPWTRKTNRNDNSPKKKKGQAYKEVIESEVSNHDLGT